MDRQREEEIRDRERERRRWIDTQREEMMDRERGDDG